MPPPERVEQRTAAVLSVGDELTLGQTLDTNSKWISERLFDLGLSPLEHVTVPDDTARQAAALRRLAGEVDVVICTGGLGPTADDLTRDALALASEDELVEDPLALAQVEEFFAARGRPMPPLNRVQARRPSRGLSLPNLNGTAPGLWARMPGGAEVFCLPGPPGELKPMFEAQVVPRLRPVRSRLVRTRVVHCFGIGESDLAARLGPVMDRSRNPLVGTTASGGVVSCRIRFEGSVDEESCEAALTQAEQDVRAAAGVYAFGAGDERLPGALLRLLRERGETLGTVESCTGGLLGSMITDMPGSSVAFVGALVTYSNRLKTLLAGVEPGMFEHAGPGAVSAACALALARGGLERLGCTHALSITGIAGPDGGVPAFDGRDAKPVGTVFIARASADGSSQVRRFRFAGDRGSVRHWSAMSALAMLRLHLVGAGETALLREAPRAQ
ncbi:MAG: CinA family nicotinamide mononucleotide deamidase-related protein [Planctomycetota bacterium]|nr:CinA family nicotinamide mononucleotide deamidase-related protein [Planctomycetota bacterium]